uniref:Putative secreted protein n=1 Tax=Anopheles darlingi TaxID=43151 RepID=A0A2M4DFE4_ANODA
MYVAPPQLLIWLSLVPGTASLPPASLFMVSRRAYNYNCKKRVTPTSHIPSCILECCGHASSGQRTLTTEVQELARWSSHVKCVWLCSGSGKVRFQSIN